MQYNDIPHDFAMMVFQLITLAYLHDYGNLLPLGYN